MGKISPTSTKYIIHATISGKGLVEKPDVIGAIFGQTEGLLGNDLELRELQKSGRIGRIDVVLERSRNGFQGEIIIPSSLNKAETALVAAAIETIERVGPSEAKIRISSVEDVRLSKRKYIVERAKELLHEMIYSTLPDSKEISAEVLEGVQTMELTRFGPEGLVAGPDVETSEEVIVVEGRADVVNLLRHGFRNAVALNGTSVPESIIELSKEKEVTLFLDGDRGGSLILEQLKSVAEVDFVAFAPSGKEVEELTKKEIHKALRAKVPVDQAHLHFNGNGERISKSVGSGVSSGGRGVGLSDDVRSVLRGFGEELLGSGGSYILDEGFNVLGKVPVSELVNSLREISGARAVVLDGVVGRDLLLACKSGGVGLVVGRELRGRGVRGVRFISFSDL